MENNSPQFTTLMLTNQDKTLIGAMLKEMPVSQQFMLSTILEQSEARAKDLLAKVSPETPEAKKKA